MKVQMRVQSPMSKVQSRYKTKVGQTWFLPFSFCLLLSAFVALPSAVCLLPTASASDPGSGDWPMWGGTADRNMISNMKGLPTTWDVKTNKNVKWMAALGSQTYGNVVVA